MITKRLWDKEYRLTINQGWYTESPREWSNVWTFIMQHRSYSLWDELFDHYWNNFEEDFAYHINSKYEIIDEFESDYSISEKEYNKIWDFINDNIIYEEVYMMDHSWISINTKAYWCRWDSSKIGYIYSHKDNITKQLILKEWEDWEKKLRDILVYEIKILNQYIEWDIYWFDIESRELIEKDWKTFYSEWDYEDWCWWFYIYSISELAKEIIWYTDIFSIKEIENCEISY